MFRLRVDFGYEAKKRYRGAEFLTGKGPGSVGLTDLNNEIHDAKHRDKERTDSGTR